MARKGKGISDEDRELWRRVSATAKPLRSARPKTPTPILGAAPTKKHEINIEPFVLGSRSLAAKTTVAMATTPLEQHTIQMDRRNFERLRKGRLRPEARLDLHGMTADVAHAGLRGFILAAHDAGLRLVLVITGKGRAWPEETGAMPIRKGVLRHSVPHWLAQPVLRARILQVAQAHDKHGGGGALYVYLRRKSGAA